MNQKGSLKWLWASLMIIGLIIFGLRLLFVFSFGGLYGLEIGVWGLMALIPLAIVALLVWGLVSLFSRKPDERNKQTYKPEEIKSSMKIQYLFYFVGIIFVFSSIWYFAYEWIAQFPKSIKLVLLLVSVVVSYIVAEFMRGSDI